MVANDPADWLLRGVAHREAGRPIDALLCFRRAIAADPGAADARFRLGEVSWQLGWAEQALQAWRDAANADARFAAPRLALAEGLLTRGDYIGARVAAAEALTIAPAELRANASHNAAAAALGDSAALTAFARQLSAQPTLSLLPAFAPALAQALERAPRDVLRDDLMAELLPLATDMPAVLLAPVVEDTFAQDPTALREALRTRTWQGSDIDPLRRIVLAVHGTDRALAMDLAATHAAMCVALPLVIPSLWPTRTGGDRLRLAWLMPSPEDALFALACQSVRETWRAFNDTTASATVLCIGNPDDTRAAMTLLPDAVYLRLPPQPDAVHARALAGSDPDVLVDLAGMRAATGPFLAARPARRVWSLSAVQPGHAPALVDKAFASADDLARGLRGLLGGTSSQSPDARVLAGWWDAAVRAHQQGDVAAAAAGYARVVAAQPGYAPAHRLLAVLARDRGDAAEAEREFAAAVDLAPDDTDTRVAAAQHLLSVHHPEQAASLLRAGLDRTPYRAPLWQSLGHAELARRDGAAAAWAYGQALRLVPADGQTHFNLGVALQMTGEVDGAVQAYQRALILQPELSSACFNLGVLLQQQGRTDPAIAAYRQTLAVNPHDVAAYKNLGEILLASGRIEAWLDNFAAFESRCPVALPLAVQALEVSQLTGDYARVERYLDGLRQERYPATAELELVDALEELLFLLLNFDVEPEMLQRFAATYDTAAQHVYGAPRPPQATRRPGKLRLGYLSGDLRDHVMGKQMWQAVEHHDRGQFELHFYSTSATRDAWTEKFAGIADGFDVVEPLGDDDAAALIARDDLDLLVDLSTHTKGARPGILALKPARVQITHIASCGTLGLSAIDYKLTDHFADLPESQAFLQETLLPMDGCVYPWRAVTPAASHLFTRAAVGVAADAFVIGAFMSPLKLSRRCMSLWRDVLVRVPRAKLVFSPNNAAQRPLYVRIAAAAGIAESRLLFLPQGRDEHENQGRYELVDIVLDTMPYGGVNVTLEALAMGVPVVTLVGKRHGERSGYSILANLGVLATVAHGGREYVDLAVRLATDAAFMAEVRGAIRANLGRSALTDQVAHTRNLEAAYLRAIAERAPGALRNS